MENPRTDCLKTCITSGLFFSEFCHKQTIWSNWIHLPLVQLRGATAVAWGFTKPLFQGKGLPAPCPWSAALWGGSLAPFWHGDKKGQGPKENSQYFQTQTTTNRKRGFQRGSKLGGKQQAELSHRDRWEFEGALGKNFGNHLKLTSS